MKNAGMHGHVQRGPPPSSRYWRQRCNIAQITAQQDCFGRPTGSIMLRPKHGDSKFETLARCSSGIPNFSDPNLSVFSMHDLDPSRTPMWKFGHSKLGDRWIDTLLVVLGR